MKLKIMIMALLLLTGIGSAVNWIPESQMEPGTSLTFNGGHVINGTRYIHNIVDYGAIAGDDICDADEIEAAIAAASPGDTILFPAGDFNYESRIDVANDLTYLGLPGSRLIDTGGNVAGGFYSADAKNITVDGLHFYGSKAVTAGTSVGICFINISNVVITNTEIEQTGNSAAVLGSSVSTSVVSDLTVTRCYFHHNGDSSAPTGDNLFSRGFTMSNIYIVGNTFEEAYHYGVVIYANRTGSGENIIFSQNMLPSASQTSISSLIIGFNGATVEGNIVSDSYNDGIALWRCCNFSVTGNTIRNIEWGDGIVIDCSSNGIISSNSITTIGSIGINLCDSTEAMGLTYNNIVIGNHISNGNTYGHAISYGIQLHHATNNYIIANIIVDGNWTRSIGEYAGTSSNYNVLLYNIANAVWNKRYAVIGSGTFYLQSSAPGSKSLANGMGIGVNTGFPSALLELNQLKSGFDYPVLYLRQADYDEEFIFFRSRSTTTNAYPLVDATDLSTPGSIAGWIKIYIQDDAESGAITDGTYYVPFYSTPT